MDSNQGTDNTVEAPTNNPPPPTRPADSPSTRPAPQPPGRVAGLARPPAPPAVAPGPGARMSEQGERKDMPKLAKMAASAIQERNMMELNAVVAEAASTLGIELSVDGVNGWIFNQQHLAFFRTVPGDAAPEGQ